MLPNNKCKNKISFDIKILNSNSRKKYLRNYSNLKEKKDIFIRKQDIYLIKLLERRIKLTKMLKNKKLDNNVIKLISPWKFQYHQDENKISKTSENFINKNKKINQSNNNNYKNIKIKYIKKQNENNSYVNYEKDKSNTLNHFDNLITSKIFNSDNSKNNKNMLKIITQSNEFRYHYNFNTKNFFKTKYNNNSKIKLPQIDKNNKTVRNNRNILKTENSFYNYKTIILKEKNNIGKNNISLSEKGIFRDKIINNNNELNLTKKIQKNKYNSIYKDHSISPLKHKKNININ